MQHLVVELVLQLVERNKVFYLVFHGWIARTRGNSHLIAQVDQPLNTPRPFFWFAKQQYGVKDFLSSHLVHIGTCIGKAGAKRREANSTRVDAFYMTLVGDVLIRKSESMNA